MKIRNSIYLAAVLFASFATVNVSAQNDLSWADRLESARKLYYSGSYYAAEKAFDDLSSSIGRTANLRRSELDAYKVLCAIALDRVNADGQVKVFSDTHPNAPELSMIKYALASKYFDRGLYKEAVEIFRTINEKYLYKDLRTEFCFKKAFGEMTLGNRKPSAEGFARIVGSHLNQYTYPSIYYLGYVNYLDRNFSEAAGLFERAAEDSRFEAMARYYALESKFMLSDHGYVTSHGDDIYSTIKEELKPNVARMMSESYFSLGENTLAQKYMDIYESSGTSLSRKDAYFSALLAYSLNSFSRAARGFGSVTAENGTDSLSQSAWYYRANCNLQLGNKIAAISDFKNASELTFDRIITEDALFNCAKLSFDVNSDISQFEKYLKQYPNTRRADIISNYMAMSYVDRKDYAAAVDLLRRIPKPDNDVTANLQKASFLRALQLIGSGSYRSAVEMLELSIANGKQNETLANLARYWDAECLFRDGKYVEAANVNKSLLANPAFRKSAEYPMTLFNQGYCLFKNGDYAGAQSHFADYLGCSDAVFEKDAGVRLADSYFMQSQYKQAASAYQGICDRYPGSDDIYPALQAAISYGLSGNGDTKMAILRETVSKHGNAPLYPRALYELGNAYFQQDQYDDASECFHTLLGMKSDSTYFAKSLLALAMISSNTQKYDKALDYYKRVVKELRGTAEAQDALAGIENVYNTLNRPADYLAYLDENGYQAVKTDAEREAMLFASAEQLFRSGNHSAAMSALQSFLATYPSGGNAYKARFYLAQSLAATSRKEAACDMYAKVINAGGAYTEQAMASYAKLSYELERYDRAAQTYAALADRTSMDDVRCSAFSGLMRSRYGMRDYEGAVAAAASVATFTYSAAEVLREADFLKAKSLVCLGRRDEALVIYKSLSSSCEDTYGAEAAYEVILDSFNSGKFEDVEQKVYALSDSNTPQIYWLAKSFIVLGDSFESRGDSAQALATFKSIADGYSSDEPDDILPTVKARVSALESQMKGGLAI